MPKALINNGIRVARPGGSEPSPSLGVRPKLAQKEDEGAFSCSVRVRATKRLRRIFSLGRCHASDRGERNREARSSRKKRTRESSAVLCECERPNVGDVYSPWGDVTLVTEGNESHEARSSRKKRSREPSAVLRACERPNVGDVYSPWGDVTLVTEGNETGRPEARTERGRGVISTSSFCASEGTRTHTHEGTRS